MRHVLFVYEEEDRELWEDFMERNLILGYFFTVLNYAFYCTSRFLRSKQSMLLLDLGSKISFLLGLICLGSFSGAYTMAISFATVIFANIKEAKQTRWPGLYVLLQGLLLWVLIFRFEGISSILVFLSFSIALFATWWLPPQKMRITGLVSNLFTLMYNISLQNWAGLFELAVIASNLGSYLKYRKAREQASA